MMSVPPTSPVSEIPLRNVLLDIEKRIEQHQLIDSDAFWRKFILKAIETKKTEALFVRACKGVGLGTVLKDFRIVRIDRYSG